MSLLSISWCTKCNRQVYEIIERPHQNKLLAIELIVKCHGEQWTQIISPQMIYTADQVRIVVPPDSIATPNPRT